jgi:hypothetical protein
VVGPGSSAEIVKPAIVGKSPDARDVILGQFRVKVTTHVHGKLCKPCENLQLVPFEVGLDKVLRPVLLLSGLSICRNLSVDDLNLDGR